MSPGGRVIELDGSQYRMAVGGEGATSRARPRPPRPPPRTSGFLGGRRHETRDRR